MHGGNGWPCKLHRMTLVGLPFAFPKVFIRRGDIDARELSRVPRSLKVLVLGHHALGLVTTVVALAIYVYLRVTGLVS
jgi:hypothetical protein